MVRDDSKNKYQKTDVFNIEIGLHAQNTITQYSTYLREPIWPFCEHENLCFDNEQHIHTNSENDEESGYGLN